MCIILDDEDATEENKFIDPVPSDNVKVVIHLIYWLLSLMHLSMV